MDIANLLNAIGITSAGAAPVIQQNNAQRIAAQRLGQIAQAAQSSNQPGFSPYPSANAGTSLPNGMPMPGSPPPAGGGMPGAPPSPFPAAGNPFAGVGPSVTPYGGPTTAPSGDPFSYPNVVNAFFGGGNAGASDFQAWQDTEKTLRPYGQLLGRSQLEGQRQEGRKELEGEKQGGRMELLQQKNAVIMRGQDKNYQGKMATIAARGSPAQQAAYKAAQVEFQQASMNYRNEKMNINSSAQSIEALADKAIAAQQKMESVVASMSGGAPGADASPEQPGTTPAKEKIKPGEEVRYDGQGNAFVNRKGQAVPAEQ